MTPGSPDQRRDAGRRSTDAGNIPQPNSVATVAAPASRPGTVAMDRVPSQTTPAECACWSAWYELRTSGPTAACENPIACASRSNIAKVSGVT